MGLMQDIEARRQAAAAAPFLVGFDVPLPFHPYSHTTRRFVSTEAEARELLEAPMKGAVRIVRAFRKGRDGRWVEFAKRSR